MEFAAVEAAPFTAAGAASETVATACISPLLRTIRNYLVEFPATAPLLPKPQR